MFCPDVGDRPIALVIFLTPKLGSSCANRCALRIFIGTIIALPSFMPFSLVLSRPAINLLRANTAPEPSGYLLSDAKGLYLRLKVSNKDRTFFRTAERNTGYVICVLGD
jgi:hypothetical protein